MAPVCSDRVLNCSNAAQEKIGKYTVILDSMTYKELENPEIINAKVIRRVSRGSGTQDSEQFLINNF